MILDIVVGVILFLSMLIAWIRGFIREVLTIFGLIGAGVAALMGAPYIAPYMLDLFPQKAAKGDSAPMLFGMIPYDIIAAALSYIVIFLVVYVLLSILAHWLAKLAKEYGLGALDRSLGLLFGLGRAVILIGLLFIPFQSFMNSDEKAEKPEWVKDSITLPYVDYTARIMKAAIPNPLEKDSTADSEDKDTAAKEEKSSQSLKEMLQNQALDSLMKTKKIIEDNGDSPQKGEGYNDSDRNAIKQLFEMQQNQNKKQQKTSE